MTGRDDARAHPPHPSVDELADFREGLLSSADEARVRAHTDGCADCAAQLAAIDEVSTLLRQAGSEPVTMPAAVARALDDALAQEATSPAARPVPERPAAERSPARYRWVKPAFGWLAGAAAAVVIVGGIGAGLKNVGGDNADSASGSGAGGADTGGGQALAPEAGPSTSVSGSDDGSVGKRPLERITKKTFSDFARAASMAGTLPRDTQGYQLDLDRARGIGCPTHGMAGLTRPVLWYDRPALVVVKRDKQEASVFSCDATPRLLYSAPY